MSVIGARHVDGWLSCTYDDWEAGWDGCRLVDWNAATDKRLQGNKLISLSKEPLFSIMALGHDPSTRTWNWPTPSRLLKSQHSKMSTFGAFETLVSFHQDWWWPRLFSSSSSTQRSFRSSHTSRLYRGTKFLAVAFRMLRAVAQAITGVRLILSGSAHIIKSAVHLARAGFDLLSIGTTFVTLSCRVYPVRPSKILISAACSSLLGLTKHSAFTVVE